MSSRRIERSFLDIGDIYVPIETDLTARKTSTGMAIAPRIPTYADVQCKFESLRELSEPLPFGRSNAMNMDTADHLRVLGSQDLQDGWYFQLKTPGHPLYGLWFIVQGNAQTYNWRAKVKMHILKRSNAPPLQERQIFEVLVSEEYPDAMGFYTNPVPPVFRAGEVIDRDLYLGGIAYLVYDGVGGTATITVTGLDENGDEQTWFASKPNGTVSGSVIMSCSREGAYLTEVTNITHSGTGIGSFYIEAREE